MSREQKLILSDFVSEDRFELNSYLNYLFSQFSDDGRDQSKDKMIVTIDEPVR